MRGEWFWVLWGLGITLVLGCAHATGGTATADCGFRSRHKPAITKLPPCNRWDPTDALYCTRDAASVLAPLNVKSYLPQ